MIDKPKQGAKVDAFQKGSGVCWVEGYDVSVSDVRTHWKLCASNDEDGVKGYIEGTTKKKSLNSDRWTSRHFMIRLNAQQIDAIIEGLQIVREEE
mgnify:FL=1